MKNKGFGTVILVILVAIAAFLGGLYFSQNRNKTISTVTPTPAVAGTNTTPTAAAAPTTIGRFTATGEEVCQENNKPLVYFFGQNTCPHCQWEHPIIQKVAAKFGSVISFHYNYDKPEADREVWDKYTTINQGGIPFIVIGCQYARVGSGENYGEADETKYLTALICKITDNKPASVCNPVKDTIDQITL